MEAHTKGSLLWGLVGALAFLVLAQAYLLLADRSIGFGPTLGVALAVFAAATVASYALHDAVY
ncbi:hypothetical protein [Halobacterium wangiae]|uniref:hypothetical protein n=1 Tax=Halobacterium wangiae TaxID=2902623 RepID=UPI001E300E88|nr:hypothetical protein [Halobacterium wangiae]